jgi:hypothetical protein
MGAAVQIIYDIPYFYFGYSVYENINLDNGTWDNKNTYVYMMPMNSFSYNYVNDAENGDIAYISMNCNGIQLQFNYGEQINLDGTALRLTDVLTKIIAALGI